MKTRIIIGTCMLIILFTACNNQPLIEKIENNVTYIWDNSGGLYINTTKFCSKMFNSHVIEHDIVDGVSLRERRYYILGIYYHNKFPLNVSLRECYPNIPDKIYKDFSEFPLEDDCYNESVCYVKWKIYEEEYIYDEEIGWVYIGDNET